MGKIVIMGEPQDGAEETLMDAPSWITPGDLTEPHPLHSPLEWQFHEAVESTQLVLRRGVHDAWIVHVAPDATTAAVPQTPTGVVESGVLGSTPTVMVVGGTLNTAGDTWLRMGRSRTVTIAY